MSEFYFSVGEEVVLKSVAHPERNGDAKVLELVDAENPVRCPHCNSASRMTQKDFGYYLDLKVPGNCCIAWHHSTLRKKHEPGQSFESLMSSLKIKVN